MNELSQLLNQNIVCIVSSVVYIMCVCEPQPMHRHIAWEQENGMRKQNRREITITHTKRVKIQHIFNVLSLKTHHTNSTFVRRW